MSKLVKFAANIAILLGLGTFAVAGTNKPPQHNALVGGEAGSSPFSPAACSDGRVLDGAYGFMVSSGQYIVGSLDFNGKCGFSGVNTYVGENGGVTDSSVTGSYSVNADGTIAISMTIGDESTPQTFVVARNRSFRGAEGIETDGNPGIIQLVGQELPKGETAYSDASVVGRYVVVCPGTLNTITFDGEGNLSGIDPTYYDGVENSNPFTGTYTVNSDGTFTGSLNGDFSAYTFYGAIENGGGQIVFLYDRAGYGVDDSCVGNH
jgi:hypothetical protein